MTGPVLAGSMRYLGLGLFLPVTPAAIGRRGRAAQGHHQASGQPGGPAALLQPAEAAR